MSMKTNDNKYKNNWDERTVKLIGREAVEKLKKSHVAVYGVGGVGGFAVEALCRAGIGEITIVDGDIITETNLNRQIISTVDTIGRSKVEVMAERISSINPEAVVHIHHCFVLPGKTIDSFNFAEFSYVVDAVDTVTLKLELVVKAKQAGTPIISSMGTGNKLDPSQLEVGDIYETSICPLAKVMRKELRARGVEELEVVYSKEESVKNNDRTPGSISFVPSSAGLLLASVVVRKLINI